MLYIVTFAHLTGAEDRGKSMARGAAEREAPARLWWVCVRNRGLAGQRHPAASQTLSGHGGLGWQAIWIWWP